MPETVEEALARARRHGRAAVAEALAATHALLDAASLATSGRPSEAQRFLAPLAKALQDLSRSLAGDADPRAASLLTALADALDAEIGRWEARADAGDPDARAVLRTFLGVRELLWELGVRRPPDRPRPTRARARVQRVRVEG